MAIKQSSATRIDRARQLVEQGRVRVEAADRYMVRGNGGTYAVDLEAERCSCPARKTCYHQVAVEVYRAANRKPKNVRAVIRKGSVKNRKRFERIMALPA